MTHNAAACANAPSPSDELLQRLSADLATLPPVIRYFDEYADVTRTIKDPKGSTHWKLDFRGTTGSLNFLELPQPLVPFAKNWVLWMLGHLDPATVHLRFRYLVLFPGGPSDLVVGFLQRPPDVKAFWLTSVLGMELAGHQIAAAKKVLEFLCDIAAFEWTPDHREFVGALPNGVTTDDYRAVRDGKVFLSFLEERKIVEHFDDLAQRIRNGNVPADDRALAASCLLYWVYAHGVRPVQIANRNVTDVRVRRVNSGPPIVHLTFRYAKQRASNKRAEDTRTMKRDWAWIMDAWVERRSSRPLDFEPDRAKSLFGHTPSDVTQAVADLTERLTGVRRTPTELRHTAAQRMVDAGASALELAEFMMHHDVDTGQVYYDISPTQADRINKALGLSPVYAELAEIVKTRVIDKARLLGLPDDQQIGAAPHGRPIVGIGGCGLGQSLCSKNPGLSCYECSKFMPLDEPEIHQDAREAVAAIVKEFVDAARPEEGNPAFMQLRRTLECIDAIIDGLAPHEQDAQ